MTNVIYHANCYDGFGAAWAAWKKLGDDGVAYRAVSHGEPPPALHNCDQGKLYILDFSYSRDTLLMLAKEFDITVLDHHKTAKDDLDGLPFATFDLGKSGAMLSWEHFHPGVEPPALIRYIQDRDLWAFSLPYSRSVAAWVQSWPFDFFTWEGIAARCDTVDGDLAGVFQEGTAILRFKDQQVRLMCDREKWVTLAGCRVPCANATAFFSEVGEELLRRNPDAPFSAYYLDWPDSRQWGLRSGPEFDCSEVAKAYGGGGHPGASGFSSSNGWFGDPD